MVAAVLRSNRGGAGVLAQKVTGLSSQHPHKLLSFSPSRPPGQVSPNSRPLSCSVPWGTCPQEVPKQAWGLLTASLGSAFTLTPTLYAVLPVVPLYWSPSSTPRDFPGTSVLLSVCALHPGCPGLEGCGSGFLHCRLWSHGFALLYPRQTSS